MLKFNASQCGFCTSGVIMCLYALLRNTATPSHQEIEQAIEGNLCRCTGYRPIREAAQSCGSNCQCSEKPSASQVTLTNQKHFLYPSSWMKEASECSVIDGKGFKWNIPTTVNALRSLLVWFHKLLTLVAKTPRSHNSEWMHRLWCQGSWKHCDWHFSNARIENRIVWANAIENRCWCNNQRN